MAFLAALAMLIAGLNQSEKLDAWCCYGISIGLAICGELSIIADRIKEKAPVPR